MALRRTLLLLAAMALVSSLNPANGQSASPPVIRVTGDVATPLNLTAADLSLLPRATVQTESDGIKVSYEGVWLHEVLKKAGTPGGTDLRGKSLASYLLAEGTDGYQVVFSLAELDPAYTANQVLLAYAADGKPLPAAQGPFRLVAPNDKRGARSVRMLAILNVVLLRK